MLVTVVNGQTTYQIVEPGHPQLTALFAAWREEIDSVPFAHEPEWTTFIGGILGEPPAGTAECPGQ